MSTRFPRRGKSSSPGFSTCCRRRGQTSYSFAGSMALTTTIAEMLPFPSVARIQFVGLRRAHQGRPQACNKLGRGGQIEAQRILLGIEISGAMDLNRADFGQHGIFDQTLDEPRDEGLQEDDAADADQDRHDGDGAASVVAAGVA